MEVEEAEAGKPSLKLPFPDVLKGKKVLLATESFGNVNGVSRTTGQLVAYLRENGVDVAVVAPASPTHPVSVPSATNPEIRLKGFPLPYNPELSVVYPFRIDRLIDRTFSPDLIYLASPASVGYQIMLQLRRLAKQPIVLCNFQTDLSGYCEIIFPWPLSKWGVWVFTSVQGWLFAHPSVRTVFYPSRFSRRYLEQAGVPTHKLLQLRRGVDTSSFSPMKRDNAYRRHILRLQPGEVDDKIILVTCCRLAPEKGFHFLSGIAHRLQAADFPFHLVIIGGNRNPQVEGEIRALFADLESSVTFTGFLMGEDLSRAYASADIKLHSSITETFGLVVLEAMASGLPVIARDEGGPSDIVAQGTAGYLVPPGDTETFVSHIIDLGSNPQKLQQFKKAAREEALLWTWEKINNSVAWQLAEAFTSSTPPASPIIPNNNDTSDLSNDNETTTLLPARSMPRASNIILRRPLLSGGIMAAATSLAIDAEITAWIAVIVGVWGGLIISFLGVLLIQLVQSRVQPLVSLARTWRESIVGREREGEGGRHVRGTRRI